jgi:hypothetical protein
MSNDFQIAATNWAFPSQIKASHPINDYNLIRAVHVISYTFGYAHGIVAAGNTSAQREDEDMNSACQPILEDVPMEDAKAQIKAYFESHHGEILDYGDIREALCIPLPTIVDACEELEREGKIAGIN